MMNQLYEFLTTNRGLILSLVFTATYFLGSLYVLVTQFDTVVKSGLESVLLGIMMASVVFSLGFYAIFLIILFLWPAIPQIIFVLAFLSSPAIPFYIIKYFKGK